MTTSKGATGKPLSFLVAPPNPCQKNDKCVLKDGHNGACWPQ